MAKYYISADLEGVCGVSSPLQCYPKDQWAGYDMAVRQLALEVTTVAESILAHDSQAEIVVNDAHSTMTNLNPEQLLPCIALLSGKPKLCAMMAGLDSSFKAALLIGYHAKAGTEKGVLNHTFHSKLFDVAINGVSCGEGGINTFYASLVHQVPVILASGDAAFCQEIAQISDGIYTVETKVGLTTTAAKSHDRETVLEAYRDATSQAVGECLKWNSNQKAKLVKLAPPYTLRMTFIHSLACDVVMTSPLYQRIDGRTVILAADDFETVYRGLQSAYTMLSYTDFME